VSEITVLLERETLQLMPGVDGRIILRWTFRKWDVGIWTGLSWLRIETGGGNFVNAVMNLRALKCGEFLD
jgi:hypothetical protein